MINGKYQINDTLFLRMNDHKIPLFYRENIWRTLTAIMHVSKQKTLLTNGDYKSMRIMIRIFLYFVIKNYGHFYTNI